MIPHLREREKTLEPFGWSQQDAEWVALVCLHSGVFTRSQYMAYFNTYPNRARRFVQNLVDLKLAVEEPIPVIRREDRTRACRITHKGIYRELGVPNIRHRRFADPGAYLRRLLSLDYVLEHAELEWLPTEEEKVWYCEEVGIPTDHLPRRIYTGAAGSVTRYFNLKLPLAGGRTSTFVYVDPGNGTSTERRHWGRAHAHVWAGMREHGITIHVAGVPLLMASPQVRLHVETHGCGPRSGLAGVRVPDMGGKNSMTRRSASESGAKSAGSRPPPIRSTGIAVAVWRAAGVSGDRVVKYISTIWCSCLCVKNSPKSLQSVENPQGALSGPEGCHRLTRHS